MCTLNILYSIFPTTSLAIDIHNVFVSSVSELESTVIKFARPGLTRQLHLNFLKTDGC